MHLRITAKAVDRRQGEAMIKELEAKVRERLGAAIYGVDAETPQSAAQQALANAGLSVIVLELGNGAVGTVGASLASYPRLLGTFSSADTGQMARSLSIELRDATPERIGQDLLGKDKRRPAGGCSG